MLTTEALSEGAEEQKPFKVFGQKCQNVKIRAIREKEARLCQILKLPPSHLLL